MGGVSEARENDHGLHGSHGWNGERNEQRLSLSVPSVVRNLPKSEFRNQNSEILVSLVIDDRDAVYPLTIDPVLATEQAKVTASDGAAFDFFGFSDLAYPR